MDIGNQKLIVIIPAYNEEKTIRGVIRDIRKHVPWADIAVVDDGSVDSTANIAGEEGAKLLRHPFNMGIGAAMQTGYKYAIRNGFDIAVQIDADGQHMPIHINALIEPILKKEADIVIGSRFLKPTGYKPTLARASGIAIFSRFVSFILKKKLTDTTSGFRAAGKGVIGFLAGAYPDDYPEVEALVLINKKGFAIMEMPVEMSERKGGRSSITGFRSVYYMIKVTLAILVDLVKKV